MQKTGQQIQEKIQKLNASGIRFINTSDNDDDVYELQSAKCKLKILISTKWLGLEFELLDLKGDLLLTYDIDSDLYDISQPKEKPFADEIENRISFFLEELEMGMILVGQTSGRPAMIVPAPEGATLVSKGKFMTKAEHYENLGEAMKHGVFSPLSL